MVENPFGTTAIFQSLPGNITERTTVRAGMLQAGNNGE
jgi:hypothetical protein